MEKEEPMVNITNEEAQISKAPTFAKGFIRPYVMDVGAYTDLDQKLVKLDCVLHNTAVRHSKIIGMAQNYTDVGDVRMKTIALHLEGGLRTIWYFISEYEAGRVFRILTKLAQTF